jgi:hypothetical protein
MKLARRTFVPCATDNGGSLGGAIFDDGRPFKIEFQKIQSGGRIVRAAYRFLRDIRPFPGVQKFFKKVKKRLVSLYFLS